MDDIYNPFLEAGGGTGDILTPGARSIIGGFQKQRDSDARATAKAEKIDPIQQEMTQQSQRKGDIGRMKASLKDEETAFIQAHGPAIFESDPLNPTKYVKDPATKQPVLKYGPGLNTGQLDGTQAMMRLRQQAATDPNAAARLKDAEAHFADNRVRLAIEKWNRIQTRHAELTGAENQIEGRLGELANARLTRSGALGTPSMQPAQPAQAAQPPPDFLNQPIDTTPTAIVSGFARGYGPVSDQPPAAAPAETPAAPAAQPAPNSGGPIKPLEIVKMHRQVKDAEAVIAMPTTSDELRAAEQQKVTDLRTKISTGMDGLVSDTMRNRVKDMTRDPTFWESTQNFVARAAEGAADTAVDTAEFALRNAARVTNAVGLTDVNAADNKGTQFLDEMRNVGAEWGPKVAKEVKEKLQNSFVSTSLAQGVGSTVGFLAPGMLLGRAAKAAGLSDAVAGTLVTLGVATTGAATEGNSLRREAEVELRAQRDAGKISNDDYLKGTAQAEAIGALIGTSEVLPIGKFAERLSKIPAGKEFVTDMLKKLGTIGTAGVQRWLQGAGKQLLHSAAHALGEGFEETVQEFGQSVAENLTASGKFGNVTWDPDRQIVTSDTVGNAQVGLLTGALFGALTSGRPHAPHAPHAPTAPAATTPPAAPVPANPAAAGPAPAAPASPTNTAPTAAAPVPPGAAATIVPPRGSNLEQPEGEEPASTGQKFTFTDAGGKQVAVEGTGIRDAITKLPDGFEPDVSKTRVESVPATPAAAPENLGEVQNNQPAAPASPSPSLGVDTTAEAKPGAAVPPSENPLREPPASEAGPGAPASPASTGVEAAAVPASDKPKYSKSSTQVTLPEHEAKPFHDYSKSIAEEDVYHDPADPSFGRESEPHVTALYGITNDDEAAVRKSLEGVGPITATLGKVSSFENADKPYDVLKVDVDSPDLHRVNAAIKAGTENKNDFPDYKPHLTLAYVKKGAAKKYVGGQDFAGKKLKFDSLQFRTRDGRSIDIKLTGKASPNGNLQKGPTETAKAPVGGKAPAAPAVAPQAAGQLAQRASAVFKQVLAENPGAKNAMWIGQFKEQIQNPSRYHPIVEDENPKGLKIGDHVTIQRPGEPAYDGIVVTVQATKASAYKGGFSVHVVTTKEGNYGGFMGINYVTKKDESGDTDTHYSSARPALIDSEGNFYIGKTGEAHVDVFDRLPDEITKSTLLSAGHIMADGTYGEGSQTMDDPQPEAQPFIKKFNAEAEKRTKESASIPRGTNKPVTFARVLIAKAGLNPSDRAGKFITEFARKLQKASPTGFAGMEVHHLTQAQWDAHTELSARTPDSAGAYDAGTNRLYINTDKTRGEAIVDTIVHEAGHFAEKFALGDKFTQGQWESLTNAQRQNAALEYNPTPERETEINRTSDADLLNDKRARSEWVAMQFARVIRGDTAQMPTSLKARLQSWLDQVRELVRKWIGSENLTTKELDAKILEKMGYASRSEQITRIGQNQDGQPLFEDAHGVRSYSERGMLLTEPVGIVPGGGFTLSSREGTRWESADENKARTGKPGKFKVSAELKAAGDELFGTPAAAPGEHGKKFGEKIEQANKVVGMIVREAPSVRSRATMAEFIAEVFPKAKPYSEALFRILGGAVDVDEAGSVADWPALYHAIDGGTKTAQPAGNERAGSTGSDSLPSGGQPDAGASARPSVASPETRPEDGGAGTSPELAPQGVERGSASGGRPSGGESDAGHAGISGRGGVGQSEGGEGGGDLGQAGPGEPANPSAGSETPVAEQRPGEGSQPDARPKRAEPAELGVNDRNHAIAPDDTLIPGGDKTKARGNLAALKLLRQLESENRNPTPEEKKILAQYVGWGGLPNVFNKGIASLRDQVKSGRYVSEVNRTELTNWEKDWGKLYDQAKELMTSEEFARASASTLNAHYTSREVISPMWDIVRRLGFTGGTALETSMGIGHFLGLEPTDLASKTKWKGVELDSITGRMAAKLYPQAQVQVTGFEDAKIANHSVDLVIGNVPFAKDGPMDGRYPRFSLHNYFFARAMDTLKPGGLMVAITSSSTMDGAGSKAARAWLAERGDLVGAIRLPNNAFKKNAGTEVTTDIVILRKHGGGAFSAGQNWLNTQQIPTYDGEKVVDVNEYFARHPEMMLGRMSLEGTMYRGDEPALLPNPNSNLSDEIKTALEKLPADVLGSKAGKIDAPVATSEGEQAAGKEGSVVIKEGKPYEIADGVLKAPAWAKSAPRAALAKSYVGIRDHLKSLLELMQAEGSSDKAIDAGRKKLNDLYDAHVKKFGALSERSHNFLEEDPELPLVQALENVKTAVKETVVKSGKYAGEKRQTFEKQYTKATIFEKRTIFPRSEPLSADTMSDAISQSIAYRNEISLPYIASLRGITEEAASALLKAEPGIFQDPKTGTFEVADSYLSGFVREKLNQAKAAAAGDPAFQKNVDALEKAQPRWLPLPEISFRLGSSWLPASLIKNFLRDKLQVNATISFVDQTGHWHVMPHSGQEGAVNKTTYGTTRVAGHEMVDDALNMKSPVVYDEIETPEGKKREKNNAETVIAQQKQQEIQQLFKDYVKTQAEAHPELEKIYNERFNGVTLRKFKGPTWDHYPNASHEVKLRQHQKDVTARILQESTLLAHSVGTGKTYIIITAAQEMRRLGMAKKPMIVTQNATTQQFAAAYKKLYPTARILVPNKKQRESGNRQRLMSQIATGDWDTVIIPQSFLNQLPDDPKRLQSFIQSEIDELEAARISANQSEGKNSPKVKDLEKAKKRLEEKLKKLLDRKTDNAVTFEQLGVDALFVDEAHAYKKLEFTTQMDNVKGLDRGASERGLGLYMKTRWIQEKNNGKNVVLATGTPVSNTIAEAWNMLRFTRPDLLAKYGVERFDSFAGAFGDTVTNIEQTAGGGFKQVTRFAKYTNGPELIAMFHSAADVVLKEDINLPDLPAVKNGQPTTITIKQTPLIKQYIGVLRDRLKAFEAMSGREKRENSHIPLVVFGLAKKATLDMRLIDANLPAEKGNKLEETAKNVARIYHESRDVKGTQLVFADLFQSPDGAFNLYHELRNQLVALGIPEEQIAIISEAKTDAARERIFEALKSGEIAAGLGSTEKMGVGVNVQDRLIALHHMDAPPRPMDIEQRNGRIVRQGNQNPVVELVNYGVENTLDATLYQRLGIKQKFINQIMRGDVDGRSFEDAADEVSMTFDEQMAAFSGNPLAMKKVGVEGEIRRLEALKQGHIRQRSQTHSRLGAEKEDLKRKQEFQPKIEKAAGTVNAALDQEATGSVDDVTYANRKDLVAGLDKSLAGFVTKQKDEIGMQIQRNGWTFPAGTVTLYGQKVQLTLTVPTNEHGIVGEGAREPSYHWETLLDGGVKLRGEATTGSGLLTSFTSQGRSLTAKAEQNQADQARINRDITEMTGFMSQPFAQEEELAKKRAEATEIDTQLQAASKEEAAKAPTAPNPDLPAINDSEDEEGPLGSPGELDAGSPAAFSFRRAPVDAETQRDHDLIRQINEARGSGYVLQEFREGQSVLDGVRDTGTEEGEQAPAGPARAQRLLQVAFGKRILFVRGAGTLTTAAMTFPQSANTILVDVRSKSPLLALIGHEIGHNMSNQRPDLYRAFSDMVLESNPVPQSYRQLKDAQGYAAGTVDQEWVNDVLGGRFDEPEFWSGVAKAQGSSKLAAVVNFARTWLERLGRRVKNILGPDTDVLKELDRVRARAADVISQYEREKPEGGYPDNPEAERMADTPASELLGTPDGESSPVSASDIIALARELDGPLFKSKLEGAKEFIAREKTKGMPLSPQMQGDQVTLAARFVLEKHLDDPRAVRLLAGRDKDAGLLGTPVVKGTAQQEEILKKVTGTLEDKRGIVERVKDYVADLKDYMQREFQQKLVDRFTAVKRLEQAALGTNKLDASVSAYKWSRLTSNLPSVMEYLLNHGRLEYKNGSMVQASGKGLAEIVKPIVEAGKLRLWEGYVAAFRANRLLAEGKEKNFGKKYDPVTATWSWDAGRAQQEIDAMLDLAKSHPEFETARREYVDFQKSILDVAESAGLIDPAKRALWEKSDYVPFYRIVDALDGKEAQGWRKRSGFSGQKSGIRQLKGGPQQVAILENMVRNIENLVDASFKNIAMQRIADLADQNTDLMVKIPFKAVPFKASFDETVNALEKAGVDTSTLSRPELEELVTFWRMRAPEGKDVVSVMRDGKAAYYRVKDKPLLRSILALGPEAHSWWMKLLQVPKHALTSFVTLDPAFMAANTIRDSFSAWTMADSPIKPGIDSAIGFLKSLRNDTSKLGIMAAGGGSGHYNNLSESEVRNTVTRMTREQRSDFVNSIIDSPAKLMKLYKDLGRASENANRIAIYDSAKKRGASDAEASFQALDIMDFGLRGDSKALSFFLDTVPFMNARMQGLYKLGRAASERPGRFATHGAIILGATLALLGKNWDDDRYWDLPEWDRDMYYHLWLGDRHVRIPKPFEVGQAFSTVPERMAEYMGKTGDAKLLGKRMLSIVADVFAMNPTPQAIRPLMDRAMNRSAMTGNPIISRGDETKKPEEQFNNFTSLLSRDIANGMPDSAPEWLRSPKSLDYFIRGYFGTMGVYALDATDAVLRPAQGLPAKPESKLGDYWVARRFTPDNDTRETKYVGQFYDLHQRVEDVVHKIRELRQQGNTAEAAKVLDENRETVAYRPVTTAAYKQLSQIRKQQGSLYESDSFGSPKDRRAQLGELATRQNSVTKQAVQGDPNRPRPPFNPFGR